MYLALGADEVRPLAMRWLRAAFNTITYGLNMFWNVLPDVTSSTTGPSAVLTWPSLLACSRMGSCRSLSLRRGAAASASACREKLMEAAVQHSHCEKCADGTKWACSSRVPLSVCTSAGLSLLCELWCGRRVLRV